MPVPAGVPVTVISAGLAAVPVPVLSAGTAAAWRFPAGGSSPVPAVASAAHQGLPVLPLPTESVPAGLPPHLPVSSRFHAPRQKPPARYSCKSP